MNPNIIANAKKRAEARKLLINTAIHEEIEAAAPHAEIIYRQLRDTILAALDEISKQESSARVLIDTSLHYQVIGATDLLCVCVGPPECNIILRVKAKVVTWSGTPVSNESNRKFWQEHMSKDAICFTFALEGGIPQAGNTEYKEGRWVTIHGNGTFYLHPLSASLGRYSDNDLGAGARGPGVESSMSDVYEFVTSVFTNERYWEYITASV